MKKIFYGLLVLFFAFITNVWSLDVYANNNVQVNNIQDNNETNEFTDETVENIDETTDITGTNEGGHTMYWGFFGTVHIISLLIGLGMIVGLYYILKGLNDKIKVIILGILSFSGIAAIIFNLVTWGSPYEYLPLHLCSLTALVLPFAVFKRSKVLTNLLLLWSLGAIMALVVNNAQANYVIPSKTFFFYYIPHLLEFAIPILMIKLNLVKKDIKCIGSTMGITLVVYTLIHFANVLLNNYFTSAQIMNPSGEIVKVNYMYSLVPENPVMQLFWNWIPYEYWYMLPILLIVSVYLGLVYIKEIVDIVKKRA